MKKLIGLLLLVLLGGPMCAQIGGRSFFEAVRIDSRIQSSIPDGRYVATVKYHNLKTNYKATYSLYVYVEDNRVVCIYFGDGGSVHAGPNNSNYGYSGGWLSFHHNYDGEIDAAYATVKVDSYSDHSTRYYYIEL